MPVTQRGSVLLASGGALNDGFGCNVALSSDALVMAVGAPYVNGTYSDQGCVRIYDWSGSAWVQRGSVLYAPSPALNDHFGAAVALSSDGAILVVGVPDYDATNTNQGGLYIYDWSGSAWVQRGSMLINSAPFGSERFGGGVAISGDGAVLAVGLPGRESSKGRVKIYDWSGSAWVARGALLTYSGEQMFGFFGEGLALNGDGTMLVVGANGLSLTYDGQGSVYVYDWSGSAWVQRGSYLVAVDPAAYTYYGVSIALNAAGTVLAVGAYSARSGGISTGAVYLYDWSGGAWVQRQKLVAGDGEASDQFGRGVALSSDALIVVVGAPGWDDSSGGEGAVYVYDVAEDNKAICYTSLTMLQSSGQAICYTRLDMDQRAIAYTRLDVVPASGVAVCRTRLDMTAHGTAIASTALAMIDAPDGIIAPQQWTARCMIDGADVSSTLTGVARVTADEGAARLAEVTIRPPSGVFAPLDYVGKPITVDYVPIIGGTAVAMRLFTGRIDTPAYDFDSGLLTLTCVDDLQNRVAALDRTTIDLMIGGRYTEAVQGVIEDNWDYAQALLQTIPASLDAGPSGGMRVTPWDSSAVWGTFGDGMLLYPRTAITYPQRSTIVNHVRIAFDYRYAHLRERRTNLGWSGTLIDMAPTGYQYPTRQDLLGAAGGSGWQVTAAIFWDAPASIAHSSGGVIKPAAGSIAMAVLKLAQRHSQTVTEQYSIDVTAPESIAENGTLYADMRGALESTFDGAAWESALDVVPLIPGGGEMDYAPDATRTDAEYAIQTLIDMANVKILSTHRSTRVTNATVCMPDIDLDKRIAIATPEIDAEGKVVGVVHELDFSAGSAITEFSIAPFGAGGAGILTPSSLTPPAAPDPATESQDWPAEIPPLFVNTFGITPYADNLMGLIINPPQNIYVEDIPGVGSRSYPNPYYVAGTYPVEGFRVQMPGVADADRNPTVIDVSQAYSVVLPVDPLEITQP